MFRKMKSKEYPDVMQSEYYQFIQENQLRMKHIVSNVRQYKNIKNCVRVK